jgi:hypothetical protein
MTQAERIAAWELAKSQGETVMASDNKMDNGGYTGGGNVTCRAVEHEVTEQNKVKLGGVQLVRTQEEKDAIDTMMSKWNTPEMKAKAKERAAWHSGTHGDNSDNYNDDF